MMADALKIFLPSSILFTLAAIYSGYWIHVGAELRRELIALSERPASESRTTLGFADVTVSGYPYRFEATLVEPKVTDTVRGITVTADALRGIAQSYDLSRVIFEAEGPFDVAIAAADGRPAQQLKATADSAAASARFVDGELSFIDVDVRGLHAAPPPGAVLAAGEETAGPETSIKRLELHTRPLEEKARELKTAMPTAGGHEVAVFIDGLTRHDLALEVLSNTIDYVELRADVTAVPNLLAFAPALFTAPTATLKAWSAQGGTLALTSSKVLWAGLNISAQGKVFVSTSGELSGAITASATGYDTVFAGLVKKGVMSEQQAVEAKSFLQRLNVMAGNVPGALRLPIALDRGDVMVGQGQMSLRVATLPRVF